MRVIPPSSLFCIPALRNRHWKFAYDSSRLGREHSRRTSNMNKCKWPSAGDGLGTVLKHVLRHQVFFIEGEELPICSPGLTVPPPEKDLLISTPERL
jgi:hypothetical protein